MKGVETDRDCEPRGRSTAERLDASDHAAELITMLCAHLEQYRATAPGRGIRRANESAPTQPLAASVHEMTKAVHGNRAQPDLREFGTGRYFPGPKRKDQRLRWAELFDHRAVVGGESCLLFCTGSLRATQ